MKHAFSRGLTGSKFWQTCKLYVCKHLLRHIISEGRFAVMFGDSTVVDITDEVVVTSDNERNLILRIVAKEKDHGKEESGRCCRSGDEGI